MSSDHLCAHCGSSAVQLKYVTRSFGKASTLLVIEAIPMWSCPTCGESYFSARTLHEIERIKVLGAVSVRRLAGIQETTKFPLPKGLKRASEHD